MPNADHIYVDPSALRCIYLHDDRSARMCAWRKRVKGGLPLTRFSRAELVNSIQLAVHRRDVELSDAIAALADISEDVRQGRLVVVDALWRRTLDLAADLSARHTARLGTRSLDVLHVATALTLEVTHLVSYDDRQTRLARGVGLRVLAP